MMNVQSIKQRFGVIGTSPKLDRAIEIMSVAFTGEFDKGDNPYSLHCLHVMRKVQHLGEAAMIPAVLHDLIEDTKWTGAKLIAEGFDPRDVAIIELLTHAKGEDYMTYVRRLSVSSIARAIKMADLRHNSDIHRMKPSDILEGGTLAPKAAARLAKYFKAYAFLRGIAA